jgi:HlyD family secretion protein
MIHDSSPMDRVVAPPGWMRGKGLMVGGTVAGLILVSILLFPSIRRWSKADRAVDGTTLAIGSVSRGDLLRDVSVQGRVVAAQHPTLVTPAQGIVALRAKAGTVVHKGDILAIVASPEVQSALQQAGAQLLTLRSDWDRQKIVGNQTDARMRQQADLSRTRLEAARRALARAEALQREGLMNKLDYERAQDDVHVAESEAEQAQREIALNREMSDFDLKSRHLQTDRQQSATEELRKKSDDLTIRAPFEGMVAAVSVADGDAVTPNQAIVSVVNLSSLELELTIPEEYAGEVKIGTPVSISYGAGQYPGHMTAISPEVVGNQVIGRAVPDNGWPDGLKQNQAVTTRLVFESKHNVIKAPRGAFLESGGGRSAYVVEGKAATRREIRVGSVSVSEVEIVSGLREGERIILSDTSSFDSAHSVILR